MWRGIPGARVEIEPEANALINDHGIFRNERGERLRDSGGGDRSMRGFRRLAWRYQDGRGIQLRSQCRQRPGGILFRSGQHMNDGPRGDHSVWLARIGEEPDRFLGANQDEVPDAGKDSDGLVDGIGKEIDREAPAPALNQSVEGRSNERSVGLGGDTMSFGERIRLERGISHHQGSWLAGAQYARYGRDRCWRHRGWSGNGKRLDGHAAFVPRGVGWEDQGSDTASASRCVHGG